MNFARPVLCLITDRRRLAERIGRAPDAPETSEALLVQVQAAAHAGVTLIQVRESHVPDAALVALVYYLVYRPPGTRGQRTGTERTRSTDLPADAAKPGP